MTATVERPRELLAPVAAPRSGLGTLRAAVRHGLKGRTRSILVWGGSLGALGAFMAAIYPSVQDALDKAVKDYPAGLKQAFGIEDLNTVEAYVHAEMFSLIVPLAIAYLAVRVVAQAVVAAEERGYLDTILALPLSRRVLLAGAYLVCGLVSAAILVITGALTFAVGRAAGTGISLGLMTAGALGVWPLAMFFGGVAALAAGAFHRSGAVTGIAMGTAVGMYALDLAGRLTDALEPLRWASAFRYYGQPLRDGIDPAAFIGLTAAGVLLAVVGALLFERRDVLA
jgi:beta-exotoxin I transport system permease protein